MSDDETVDDLPPFYAGGPPTIEEQISPFHDRGPTGHTIPGASPPGMPQQLTPPVIRSKAPSPEGVAGAPPLLVPPKIINAPDSGSIPSSSEISPLDGVTQADGLPMMLPSDRWEPPRDPDSASLRDLDGLPTDPYARHPLQGTVPSPDAPNVEISKSMAWDVAHLDEEPPQEPAVPPRVAAARRRVAAPTEVMLPVLEKKRKKERSDAWLVVGLIVLAVVILGLFSAVILGVLQRVL